MDKRKNRCITLDRFGRTWCPPDPPQESMRRHREKKRISRRFVPALPNAPSGGDQLSRTDKDKARVYPRSRMRRQLEAPELDRLNVEEVQLAELVRAAQLANEEGVRSAQRYLNARGNDHELLPEHATDRGAIFRNRENGNLKVAFQGTDFKSGRDLNADIQIATGAGLDSTHPEFLAANDLMKTATQLGTVEHVAGHSLGGAKAIVAAENFAPSADITVFNPAINGRIIDDVANRPQRQARPVMEEFATSHRGGELGTRYPLPGLAQESKQSAFDEGIGRRKIVRTPRDPVSILHEGMNSAGYEVKTTAPLPRNRNILNEHYLDNFQRIYGDYGEGVRYQREHPGERHARIAWDKAAQHKELESFDRMIEHERSFSDFLRSYHPEKIGENGLFVDDAAGYAMRWVEAGKTFSPDELNRFRETDDLWGLLPIEGDPPEMQNRFRENAREHILKLERETGAGRKYLDSYDVHNKTIADRAIDLLRTGGRQMQTYSDVLNQNFGNRVVADNFERADLLGRASNRLADFAAGGLEYYRDQTGATSRDAQQRINELLQNRQSRRDARQRERMANLNEPIRSEAEDAMHNAVSGDRPRRSLGADETKANTPMEEAVRLGLFPDEALPQNDMEDDVNLGGEESTLLETTGEEPINPNASIDGAATTHSERQEFLQKSSVERERTLDLVEKGRTAAHDAFNSEMEHHTNVGSKLLNAVGEANQSTVAKTGASVSSHIANAGLGMYAGLVGQDIAEKVLGEDANPDAVSALAGTAQTGIMQGAGKVAEGGARVFSGGSALAAAGEETSLMSSAAGVGLELGAGAVAGVAGYEAGQAAGKAGQNVAKALGGSEKVQEEVGEASALTVGSAVGGAAFEGTTLLSSILAGAATGELEGGLQGAAFTGGASVLVGAGLGAAVGAASYGLSKIPGVSDTASKVASATKTGVDSAIDWTGQAVKDTGHALASAASDVGDFLTFWD